MDYTDDDDYNDGWRQRREEQDQHQIVGRKDE